MTGSHRHHAHAGRSDGRGDPRRVEHRRGHHPAQPDEAASAVGRLYRMPKQGYLCGVAAGIAAYFGIQAWIIRLGIVMGLFVFALPTLLSYIVLAIFLPRAPETLYRDEAEEIFWRDVRLDPSRSFSHLRYRFRELDHRLQSLEAYVTSETYRVQREFNSLDR